MSFTIKKMDEGFKTYSFLSQFQPLVEQLLSGQDIKVYSGKLDEYAVRYVASVECGRMVGILAGYLNDKVGHVAFLSFVFIDPTFARQGCGRAMLDRFFLDAIRSGMTSIRLEVFKKNTRAINFYETLNFEKAEDKTVSIVMSRSLR